MLKAPAPLLLLSATVLLLTAAPRTGIRIGPMPLYLIDILLLFTFIKSLAIRRRRTTASPLKYLILAIAVFAVLSEIRATIVSSAPLEPIYELIRILLAMTLFFSVSRIVRTESDLEWVAKAAALGIIITASLMILTSVPVTRHLATTFVFSNSFFEPASEGTLRMYADTTDPMRGRSLVGVSILSGAFMNTLLPLMALLYVWPRGLTPLWRRIVLVTLALAPIAIVMSYSRGAILGLFFVIGGSLLLGQQGTRKALVIAVLFGVAVFSTIGWDSNYFFFERLENRTQAMLQNPYEDPREAARVFAYVHPFFHLQANPSFLVLGGGQTFYGYTIADHAVFAKAYLAYGFLAALAYMLLITLALARAWREVKKRRNKRSLDYNFAQAVFVGFLGMLPWLMFGHAAVSAPRGAMLFFLMLGLLAALSNFRVGAAYPQRAVLRMPGIGRLSRS